MSRTLRPIIVVFALALLFAASSPLRAADTYTFRSRFYRITTDVSRDLARRIARHMDAVHRAYLRRFADFHGQTQPLPLHVYADHEDYLAFLEEHGIDGTATGGVFFVQPSGTALATFIEGQSRARMFHTLRHEGLHQFAWNYIGHTLPVWANEGLAEYFGEAIMVGGRLRTGLVPPGRVKRLQHYIRTGGFLPLTELLTMTHDQWSARVRRGKGAVLYDQAWSLVYFLAHADPRYRRAFQRYLDLLAAGRGAEQAFRQAFGADVHRAMRERWLQYVRDLEPDPVKEAAYRLRFLAHGLKLLHERDITPRSIAQLRTKLRAMNFRVRRTLGHGMTIVQSAREENLFRAPQTDTGRRGARLHLIPTPRDPLPPKLAITGLELPVRLTWTRTGGGEPVGRVRFQ